MAETIKNPSLEIFENFKSAMDSVTVAFGASSTIANTKKRFARMTVMGTPTRFRDIAGNETAIAPAVQIEYFCTSGLNDLYAMDEMGHQAMTDMGFQRSFGPEPIDNIDSNIKRLISRYASVYTGEPLS